MKNDEVINVGGSIENALKGHYQIDVQSVLKEAWQLTKDSRVAINLGVIFVAILGMVATMISSHFFGGIELVTEDPQAFMFVNIIVTLIIWPFLAGVEMMGVFHAFGMKTNPRLVFAFLKRGSWVAICALLTSTFVSIGFQLLVLPGIFLAVALSLTIPLVIEKKFTPMKAISTSILATRFQWFRIFAIYLILLLFLFAAIVPIQLFAQLGMTPVGVVLFLFCMTYLVPMFYNVKGILYREIFGMKLHAINADNVNPDNIFTA